MGRKVLPEGQRIAAALRRWFRGDDGQACTVGAPSGYYLRNRLELAFLAGVEAGKKIAHEERESG